MDVSVNKLAVMLQLQEAHSALAVVRAMKKPSRKQIVQVRMVLSRTLQNVGGVAVDVAADGAECVNAVQSAGVDAYAPKRSPPGKPFRVWLCADFSGRAAPPAQPPGYAGKAVLGTPAKPGKPFWEP